MANAPHTTEDWLHKALAATSPAERARFAERGLAARRRLHKTTHAMLLRQLYLSYYENRRFARARAVALRALELNVLADVIHQDIARAALAERDVEAALCHLRLAARCAPLARRPFHLWTLGSTLLLLHRYAQASAALARALRSAVHNRALYRAHLALARLAMGERVNGLQATIHELATAPCGQGYGRFVLGHLAYAAGAWAPARRYLQAFVRRTESARPAVAIALAGELQMARATLVKMAIA